MRAPEGGGGKSIGLVSYSELEQQPYMSCDSAMLHMLGSAARVSPSNIDSGVVGHEN